MIEILKKSLQERACPFVRKRCLAYDYVQLNSIRMLLAVFDPTVVFPAEISLNFPTGSACAKLGSASILPHPDLHQSERLALSRQVLYEFGEIDIRMSCVSIALFFFCLFFSYVSHFAL